MGSKRVDAGGSQGKQPPAVLRRKGPAPQALVPSVRVWRRDDPPAKAHPVQLERPLRIGKKESARDAEDRRRRNVEAFARIESENPVESHSYRPWGSGARSKSPARRRSR